MDTTIKRQSTLQIGENEFNAARDAYLQAYDTYINQQTVVNRNAMYQAQQKFEAIRKLYEQGRSLLIQKRVIDRQ